MAPSQPEFDIAVRADNRIRYQCFTRQKTYDVMLLALTNLSLILCCSVFYNTLNNFAAIEGSGDLQPSDANSGPSTPAEAQRSPHGSTCAATTSANDEINEEET
ncbi:hypothetical protein Tsubulata_036042 [Turnera subulata]|uniref:Uncharacterized protein n=1 Tax=Turnera subulata TaxID=218843 RepID=A0A9Q0F0D5_9ROSI|nr:hypothetical protein Tsubulata_036042 [Turnera subulata]